VFCAQEGLGEPPVREDLVARLPALRAEADEITFVGGEPTLSPALVAAIAAARTAGFLRIGIQTNGRRLRDRAFTDGLAAAGLSDVHVSVHGAEAAVHDYHTGRDGSFSELLAGLVAARGAGLRIAATTVLTRSNFRALHGLPALLARAGVAGWLIEIPRVAGRAAAVFDRVVPRLGLALPFALHALDLAQALHLPAYLRGAPLCLVGPFAARTLADEPRAFGGACDGCSVRDRCPGLDEVYLERFGADELRTLKLALPVVEEHGPAALRRMFVGVGELAPAPAGGAVPPPAAQLRRSLPVLGKVKPAIAEVSAGAPRRTGEALKEIFPELFDKPKG